MQLGLRNQPVVESHCGHAFTFSPASLAIASAQPGKISDRWADRESPGVSDGTDDREAHKGRGPTTCVSMALTS